MATRMQMVEELIALLNPKKLTEATLKQELSSTLACLNADEMTVQEYQAITEFQDAVKKVDMCVFNTYMGSTLLSDQDLKSALRFYASPVGRKLLTERAELQKDAEPFIKRLVTLVAGHFVTLTQRKMHMMFIEIIHALDNNVSREDAAELAMRVMQNNPLLPTPEQSNATTNAVPEVHAGSLAMRVMQNNPLLPTPEQSNATTNAVPEVHAGSHEVHSRATLAKVMEGVFAKMRETVAPGQPRESNRTANATQPSLNGSSTNNAEHVDVDLRDAVDA